MLKTSKAWRIIPRPLLETVLNNHVQHHRVNQPLILHGPRGVGKTTVILERNTLSISSVLSFISLCVIIFILFFLRSYGELEQGATPHRLCRFCSIDQGTPSFSQCLFSLEFMVLLLFPPSSSISSENTPGKMPRIHG